MHQLPDKKLKHSQVLDYRPDWLAGIGKYICKKH